MSTELKPCPFCGGEAQLAVGSPGGFFVTHSCGWDGFASEMFGYRYSSEAEAIAAWNRRAPSPDMREGLPLDRETLGRMVREAWVRWALTQPAPKPSWLVPYDELSEPDKEADRQIGEAIAKWTMIHHEARNSLASPDMREAVEALEEYAREATKAITGLVGGGSELFDKQIGDLYTADLEYCVARIRNRFADGHEAKVALAKAETNLRHWREECGKLHAQVRSLTGAKP